MVRVIHIPHSWVSSPPTPLPMVHLSGGNSDILNLHVSMFTCCVPVNLTLLIGIFGASVVRDTETLVSLLLERWQHGN